MPSARASASSSAHLRVVEARRRSAGCSRRRSRAPRRPGTRSTMKSLRSTGSAHAARACSQVVGCALEELRVGQHRQAGRAVPLRSSAAIVGRDRSRARSTPLLGLAFLISAITAGAARPRSCARSAPAKSRVRTRLLGVARASRRSGAARLRRGDLLALDARRSVEDVGHRAQRCASCLRDASTNWSQLGAAPRRDAIASRAVRDAVGRSIGATLAAYSAAPALSTTMSRAGPGSLSSTAQQHRLRLLRRLDLAARGCSPSAGRSPPGGSRTRAISPSLQLADHRRARRARPRPCRPGRRPPARARRPGAAARAPGCRPGRDGTRPSGCSARRPDW